jgi:hypothetical protein
MIAASLTQSGRGNAMTFTAPLGAALLAGALLTLSPSTPRAEPIGPVRAVEGCLGKSAALGPVSVSPSGRMSFAGAPLFAALGPSAVSEFGYLGLVRPQNSTYRLIIYGNGHVGPLEAAVVDFASKRVVNPGLFGPSRVRGSGAARNVLQFPAQCSETTMQPYSEFGWSSFGGDRYLAGRVTAMEGEAGLMIVDLHTGKWAWWQPEPGAYPRPPGKLPAGRPLPELMLRSAAPDRIRTHRIDDATGQIELDAAFDFHCNSWMSSEDECARAGVPEYTGEAEPGPRLSKTYRITLTLRR